MARRCWLPILCLCVLCGLGWGDTEPYVVKSAREKCAADQKTALVTYYKAMGAGQYKHLEQLRGTLQKEKDPELLTTLAAQVKEATERSAFYEAMAGGSAAFRIAADKPWQPTIPVKAGMMVQVWGEGRWCSDVKKRANHTYDADGEPGHDFAYLAAKVGGGPSERVGKYRCLAMADNGELAFEMHDAGKADNDGVLAVTVVVLPPTTIEAMEAPEKDALLAYYKAIVAAEENQLKELAQGVAQSRDANVIMAITDQMYRVREPLAFHSALVNGSAGYKVSAAKGWQPALRVTKGDVVHVYAIGVWCFDNRDRAAHTHDADGVIGKDLAYLEGRIGEGPSFRVGRSKTIKVTEDGDLSFEMHDSIRSDNEGALTVYVSIETPGGFRLKGLTD